MTTVFISISIGSFDLPDYHDFPPHCAEAGNVIADNVSEEFSNVFVVKFGGYGCRITNDEFFKIVEDLRRFEMVRTCIY